MVQQHSSFDVFFICSCVWDEFDAGREQQELGHCCCSWLSDMGYITDRRSKYTKCWCTVCLWGCDTKEISNNERVSFKYKTSWNPSSCLHHVLLCMEHELENQWGLPSSDNSWNLLLLSKLSHSHPLSLIIYYCIQSNIYLFCFSTNMDPLHPGTSCSVCLCGEG